MAIKRVCDRCGAEINPQSSATYLHLLRACESAPVTDSTELCVSCARQIREWLNPVKPKALSGKEANHA